MREWAELAASALEAGRPREREREVRQSAVRLVRWARRFGIERHAVADRLGVFVRTLREWERRWRLDRLAACVLGRPRIELTRAQRQDALELLRASAGRIGVKELWKQVEGPAGRRALEDLKARWRYAAHRRGGRLCGVVEWLHAGTVWAADWTQPDCKIDGLYERVLVVRDLASGMCLAALACEREDGDQVARVLAILIQRHGAPAVVKRDNGGSLGTDAVDCVLSAHGILGLNSPPGTPGYNGACEAGIGSLKVHAHHHASVCGRALAWTCDDLEAARVQVNARVHETGLSAADIWSTRRPLGERERERLWSRYRTHWQAEHAARGIAAARVLARHEKASLDRAAISRALEEEGLVRFGSRWIRPPIRGRKVADNS